ncbi:hypothetical protein BHE74_00028560 [Ensete ventricosum]|nr:hypothetical protein BHE74_00028560 [Ensete ventricosum]
MTSCNIGNPSAATQPLPAMPFSAIEITDCCLSLLYHRDHPLPHHPATSLFFLCNHTKYDVTDVMAMDDALDAWFKASKARIEDSLQELLYEFKRSRSEKYDNGQDTGYPRKREEFPRWEDGGLIGWISCAKKFSHYHRTLEESIVEIASTQLNSDVIQRYDLYETYHGVPS